MKIMKVKEKPYRKYEVKNLPKDSEYRQHDVNNNEIYFSEAKQSYYVVIK